MKLLLVTVSMIVSSFAFAGTPNSYGPGAYSKNTVVCWDKKDTAANCKPVTYKMYAPRTETATIRDGKNGNVVTFKRKVTGNYTSGSLSAEEILRNNSNKDGRKKFQREYK